MVLIIDLNRVLAEYCTSPAHSVDGASSMATLSGPHKPTLQSIKVIFWFSVEFVLCLWCNFTENSAVLQHASEGRGNRRQRIFVRPQGKLPHK